LVLIAPAGVPTQSNRLADIAKLPFVGEWLMRIFSVQVVMRGASRSYSTRAPSEAFLRGLREQMVYRGYRRALLSSLRHVPIQWMKGTYTQMQTQRYPSLVLWGQQDRVIPIQSGRLYLKRWFPRARFVEIPHAGHLPHHEAPALVAAHLIGFLR
jgi:pimeloyl-ACP methyl ester carboxylesterase